MKLTEFDYNLPKEYIAQKPASPRDSSKLMSVNYKNNQISDCIFNELPNFLKKGDILVFNNTKVFPARLLGKKETYLHQDFGRQAGGGRVEIFLLTKHKNNIWEVIIGGKRIKEEMLIIFSKNFNCKVVQNISSNIWKVKFNKKGKELDEFIDKYGNIPIPPYIKSSTKKSQLKKEYQTVYAEKRGSVAAPTAGLHFTKTLMNKLKKQGIIFKYVTLHVGLGTFEPVKENKIEDHKIHSEFGILDQKTADYLNKARQEKRRIIVIGTTALRVLEAFSLKSGKLKAQKKWINIFIYPSYKFKFVDNLLTNFHLPKSTLLMLVSALAGKEIIKKAYRKAIKDKYRFFSFGDAMLLLDNKFKIDY